MKQVVLLTGVILWLSTSSALAALTADTAWAVDTAGNNNNGGCYDIGASGTDFTDTETTTVWSVSDLAQTALSTTLTSVSAPFASNQVGNCIQITGTGAGAFTAGFYEITVFTNTSTVTIDRTACATSDCTSGTGQLGGALASTAGVLAPVLAGQTVWIKAGTYNETIDTAVAGTSTAPITWIGFSSTRGDNPTGSSRPLFESGDTRANGILADQGNNGFRNLVTQNATADGISSASDNFFWNVRSTSNTDDGFDDISNNNRYVFFDCEFDNNTGSGVEFSTGSGAATPMVGSFLHDNGALGITSVPGSSCVSSVVDSNSADGWDDVGIVLYQCTAFNNTGVNVDGFDEISVDAVAVNNASTNNGAYGFQGAAAGQWGIFDYNGYNGNSTSPGFVNITAGPNDVTGAPSYTNAAGGDFTVTGTSPYLGAGFPQAFTTATGDYQNNIGLDQGDHTEGGVAWGF